MREVRVKVGGGKERRDDRVEIFNETSHDALTRS